MKAKTKEALCCALWAAISAIAARQSFMADSVFIAWLKALTAVLAGTFGLILAWELRRDR